MKNEHAHKKVLFPSPKQFEMSTTLRGEYLMAALDGYKFNLSKCNVEAFIVSFSELCDQD